jgi:hypothetical protein
MTAVVDEGNAAEFLYSVTSPYRRRRRQFALRTYCKNPLGHNLIVTFSLHH